MSPFLLLNGRFREVHPAAAPDSVSDAGGGRPLGGELAGASARSGALCIGNWVPDVRDLALRVATRGFGRRVAWLDPGTTKNGEGRGIPLNNDAVLALREVEGIHAAWCFTYQGKRMEAVGSAWERSLRRAGIEKFRFHDLRHTWASWHLMSGTHLQELMELGGWKSFEMVLRYAHLAPEHLASAAMRIERAWDVVDSNPTNSLRQA